MFFGPCFPHDFAAVYGLFLARRLRGCPIRQQIINRELPGMCRVCIQCVDHGRPFLNDSNSRVTMTVDPPLVTLGQPKPTFKIEIVLELFKLALADKKASEEANHHLDHVLVDRILGRLEFINQLVELLLAIRTILPRFQGRGYLLDILDVFSDFLLLGLDCVQTSVDATGQAAELLLFEAPFFSSIFRWIDSRTSFKASAICRPGGWRGPP